MARSFSNVKAISSLVANEISAFSSRRGFAAAAQGSVSSSSKTGAPMMMKKGSEESVKSAWGPDPVTGYYRPEGKAKEIDAVELRELLLKNKRRTQ